MGVVFRWQRPACPSGWAARRPDVNITARIYSHALPDDDTRAADTWESMLKGPVSMTWACAPVT